MVWFKTPKAFVVEAQSQRLPTRTRWSARWAVSPVACLAALTIYIFTDSNSELTFDSV